MLVVSLANLKYSKNAQANTQDAKKVCWSHVKGFTSNSLAMVA
jgi:hypothetical protein